MTTATDDKVAERAAEKIAKARAELILAQTFYGVLVSQVEPVASRQFPTMATNGSKHFYNPEFIDSLDQDEVLGTQEHETEHDARRHHTRRGWRDAKKWNIACDYAINPDLIRKGSKLPKGVLLDWQYEGWSAEDIYRARELDEKQQQQQQQQQPQADEDDESEGKQPQAGDDDADDNQPDDEAGDQPGEQDEGDDGDEAGGDAGGEAEDDESGEQGDGAGVDGKPGEAGGEGEGSGEGAGEAEGDGAGEGTGQADGEASDDGKPGQQSCGDPGGCGEVLDAAEEPAALADVDAKWERVVRQAAMLAAKRGDAPGHITREIARNDHPPQDWRETLRAFFDGGASTTETWSRPNRRLIGSGIYLPGRQRDGVNRAALLVDTSGSMDDIALAAIGVEVQAALDENIIDELVVIYGDTRVTRVDTYRPGDEIEFDPRGGGGTELKPLFKYVADEVDASLIVCFTDMEIGDPGPEPACPVLFAATGYPDKVRRYLANAPWGAAGIDVGSH